MQTVAEKQQTEKVNAERQQAGTEAARSVAEAVKRVADAAVAEVQKTAPRTDTGEFIFSGVAGGRFEIRANNTLGHSGVVKMGQQQLDTKEWGPSYIRGILPADVKPGEVTVQIDEKTARRGYFVG